MKTFKILPRKEVNSLDKKINKVLDEITIDDFNQEDSIVTLDGYEVSKFGYETRSDNYHQKGFYTYDNNLDQTVPAIHQGMKNPSAEDRQKNSSGRKYFLPRQLKSKRSKNIQFWKERTDALSEISSRYPQISIRLKGLGNRSAQELMSLYVYILLKEKDFYNIPIISIQLRDILERRARSHQYQGKWKILSKLLMYHDYPALQEHIFFDEFLGDRISTRSLYGNILPKGRQIYENLKVELTCDPVKKPSWKRGYRDKNSRKPVHEIHEAITFTREEQKQTRENLTPEHGKVTLSYLYGGSLPTKYVENESDQVVEYRKRYNKQLKERKRKEKQRIKDLCGPVITYKLND